MNLRRSSTLALTALGLDGYCHAQTSDTAVSSGAW